MALLLSSGPAALKQSEASSALAPGEFILKDREISKIDVVPRVEPGVFTSVSIRDFRSGHATYERGKIERINAAVTIAVTVRARTTPASKTGRNDPIDFDKVPSRIKSRPAAVIERLNCANPTKTLVDQMGPSGTVPF